MTQIFEHNGVALAFDDTGRSERPPILFLAGLSTARTTWARIVPAVADRYRVLRLDHRGHGDSAHVPGTYTLEHYGADAAAFCEQVAGDRAVLVGHSLGGVVAAHLAQTRPELVRGALLEEPPLYRYDPADTTASPVAALFPMARQVLRELRERHATLDEYEALVRAAPSLTGAGTLADVLGPKGTVAEARALKNADPDVFTPAIERTALAAFQPDLPLACPVRVLRADPLFGAVFTAEDEARFRSPNPHATLVVVEGASHAIHDEQPDRFRAELLAFLAELDGDTK
jgi:pimeloyl-ACP methyl ester carboxylesterase